MTNREAPSNLHRRTQLKLLTAAGIAAGALVTTAALDHPADTPSTSGDLACGVIVHANDTQSGIAADFQTKLSNVKVFHPDSLVPEADPGSESQPGDTAIVKGVNSITCRKLGGVIVGPDSVKPIIE